MKVILKRKPSTTTTTKKTKRNPWKPHSKSWSDWGKLSSEFILKEGEKRERKKRVLDNKGVEMSNKEKQKLKNLSVIQDL